MFVNCNMDVSGKAGVQYAYGYAGGVITLNAVAGNAINSDLLMSPWDGRTIVPNQAPETYAVSAPIICNILTGFEKLIPSFLLPSIRMAFTIDQLAHFTNYTNGGNTVTAFSISNIQITYQLIECVVKKFRI